MKKTLILKALLLVNVLAASSFTLPSNADFPTPGIYGEKTPPAVTLSMSAPTGSNGWYNKPVSIAVKAFDESGIASTSISIGGGTWYKNALTVKRDGSFWIIGKARDRAGNTSTARAYIHVDMTPPEITFDYNQPDGKFDWYTGPVAFELSGRDNLSGVVRTSLTAKKVDESYAAVPVESIAVFPSDQVRAFEEILPVEIISREHARTAVSENGRYVISGYVLDEAGNKTRIETEVLIDQTAPSIRAQSPGEFYGTVTLKGFAEDSDSGINKMFIDVGQGWQRMWNDGGTWQFDWSTDGLKDGEYSYSVKAIDIAGNETKIQSSAFVINHFWPFFAFIGVILSVGILHIYDPRRYAWKDLTFSLAKYAKMDMNAIKVFGREHK